MSEPTLPPFLTRAMRMTLEPPVERADGTPETRIAVALSSEEPVERIDWMTGKRYQEVLSHEAGGVDFSMARDGMPFLLDHNHRTQIGIIEDLRLDSDRKLRGFVRMGNHPDAAWVERDIRGGIRTKISVGYDPGETYDEKSDDEQVTRVYRGWRPMEGSSVAIPADISVGVGRSAAPVAPDPIQPAAAQRAEERETMSEKIEPTPAPGGAGPSAAEQREKDLKRLAGIARDYPKHADFAGWVERGITPEQAYEEIAGKQRDEAKAEPTVPGHIDLDAKDAKRYNVGRAILALANQGAGQRDAWKDAGLEMEVHQAIADRSGQKARGLFVPLTMPVNLEAASRAQRAMQERTSVTGAIVGTSSLGGAGVQTSVLSLIELLRARVVVAGLGARFLTGLSDSITFPRQITANSFNWPGENPSSANALSAATFDTVSLAPKVAMSSTAYSRRMLAQSSFDVSAWVFDDLARVNAVGLDSAAINGSGTLQPVGIRSQSGVNSQTLGTNGGSMAWADLVTAETTIANANADISAMAWLTNPKVRGKLKTTLKSTTAGAAYLWESDGNVGGYPAAVSTSVPSNLTKGTSTTICSAAILGCWDQLLIGEWGGAVDIVVDPYTYVQQNMIQVVSCLMADVAVRHPDSFVYIADILTT
jgi:HK97 family phage major capsid protein